MKTLSQNTPKKRRALWISNAPDRHEVGDGFPLVLLPGFARSFDAIFPLNKNTRLTSNTTWRWGDSVQF